MLENTMIHICVEINYRPKEKQTTGVENTRGKQINNFLITLLILKYCCNVDSK